MRRFLISLVSIAALPAIAFAQRGGGGMGAGMAHSAMAAPAAHMAMHAAPATSAHVASGGARSYAGYPRFVRTRSGAIVARTSPRPTTTVRSNGTVLSNRALRSQDVPGLGFDYPHLAATHPNGIHDHDHDRNRRFDNGFFPLFFGGGYYMPLYPDDVDEGPATDAQAVDNGQPDPSQPALRPGDYDSRQNRPSAPSRDVVAEQAPEPYVFVRRDGTLFFASAYAWENGTLRYITAEGLRRSVTADKLDLNATQQFNEQRGLTFRLPA